MKAHTVLRAALSLTMAAASIPAAPSDSNWPSFRGAFARGVADGFATPVSWNVAGAKNVKWKTAIPGLAHSCPVVWGDRVFVTTAVGAKAEPELKVGMYGDVRPVRERDVHAWKVYCLDKSSGQILWERTAHTGVPKVKRHPKSSHANSTPATDGKHVVVFFGSEGLYCYDLAGKLLWQKDFGVLNSCFFRMPSAQWGFASSPIINRGRVIVQCDVQKSSFLAAFDVVTGQEIWRTPRDEVPTWSTPTVHESDGQTQIIVNGFKHIGGYDFETGKELWRLRGGGDIPVPTPIISHGLTFITNAHGRMSPIYAIRTTAKGAISESDSVAWSHRRAGSYMPTPIVYGDYLYVCRDRGAVTCYRADTGKKVYSDRVRGTFSASPVAADGKLYLTSEAGDVQVVKAGPQFELLATNSLGEICMATPAISAGTLFFRTRRHVVAVGTK